jgi:hypothetical protein
MELVTISHTFQEEVASIVINTGVMKHAVIGFRKLCNLIKTILLFYIGSIYEKELWSWKCALEILTELHVFRPNDYEKKKHWFSACRQSVCMNGWIDVRLNGWTDCILIPWSSVFPSQVGARWIWTLQLKKVRGPSHEPQNPKLWFSWKRLQRIWLISSIK